MKLPIISSSLSKRTSIISTFKGLNQNLITSDGEWADMKNISDRFYPAAATRPPRGTAERAFSNPKGILYKNGLFYIDGTKACYKGTEVFTVTDSDKLIAGMGAYICVFPDGIIYNTHTGERTNMVSTFTPSSTVTFAPLSDKSVFTKITASGIHNYFSKNDNVTISGCTNSAYNATKVITESGTDYIVVTGSLDKSFTQSSGLTFTRKIPELDYVAERDNRLWGCSSKNHEVYCCKVGDPKNWYNYESGADNAWAATVGSDGDFTACTKFSTYMLFFKENAIHILRGDKPSNFSLTEKELPGVRAGCSRSVQIIDETLYYVGRNGVYAFDGSVPQKISNNITEDISEAVSGTYQSKLYISCLLGGKRTLLVYDPRTGIWEKEDDATFLYAAYSDGQLHFVDANKTLRTISGSEKEIIDWYLESGDIEEGSLDQKYISKLKLNLWLEINSEVTVKLKFDDEPLWQKKGYIRSTRNKTYTIPIMPRRTGKYRIRLEGRGQFKLLGMSKEVEQGSEVNGSIHVGFRR